MAENLTPLEAHTKINDLRQTLERLNHAYYDLDQPEVSDATYDQLMRELRALEAEFPEFVEASSPSQKVGGVSSDNLGRVEHIVPMLSLKDVFSTAEVYDFTRDIRKQYSGAKFTVEQKIDGLSLCVRYRNGEFELACTRGDGIHYGEDVSEAAKRLRGLPMKIKEAVPFLQIRAEVYLSYSDFVAANKEQEAAAKPLFANPRNCAAGTLRQLDPEAVTRRGLSYFAFDLMMIEGKEFKHDTEALLWLADQGFQVIPEISICESDEEIEVAIESIASKRDSLAYGIDGAVIKVDRLDSRSELGNTSKTPRWAVAYKYPPEEKESTVRDIIVQVGRSGKMTPLAILEPVLIAGSTVSRATLHNQDMIDLLDVRVGDRVLITKSGDIIPAVVRVLKESRPENSQKWEMPSSCPVCGAKAVNKSGGVHLYCSGDNCPAKTQRALEYFASKAAMNIDGLGPQSIDALQEKGVLQDIPDLYRLKDQREKLIEWGVVGREKRVDNLLEAIERSKENPLWRILAGLGIPNIGPQAAKALESHFQGMEAIISASLEDYLKVADIGPLSAEALVAFFENELNLQLIHDLEDLGVNMISLEKAESSKLAGKSFVLSGSLEHYSRDEMKEMIEQAGGKVSSAVSKKTDYLLIGDKAGSKLQKAESLGVMIIHEEDILQMLRE